MEIKLVNSDLVVLVDEKDRDKVAGFQWSLSALGYVRRVGPGNILLHKFILGVPVGSTIHIHHKDNNKLNNARSNLVRSNKHNHISTHNKESAVSMKEWAIENGIKGHENMNTQDIYRVQRKLLPQPRGFKKDFLY